MCNTTITEYAIAEYVCCAIVEYVIAENVIAEMGSHANSSVALIYIRIVLNGSSKSKNIHEN